VSPERRELLKRLNLLTECEVLLLMGWDRDFFMEMRLGRKHCLKEIILNDPDSDGPDSDGTSCFEESDFLSWLRSDDVDDYPPVVRAR
jgi:hypothetical protein